MTRIVEERILAIALWTSDSRLYLECLYVHSLFLFYKFVSCRCSGRPLLPDQLHRIDWRRKFVGSVMRVFPFSMYMRWFAWARLDRLV